MAVTLMGITNKVEVSKKVILRDGLGLIFCEFLLMYVIYKNRIDWLDGLILMSSYLIYLFYMFTSMKSVENVSLISNKAEGKGKTPILKSIVGKKVDRAIRDLTFSDKRISKDVKKTISSAVSNAENNYQYDIDNLYVKEAYVGKSIVMKRFRPRAKGRAAPIKKPFSRITIILEEKQNKTKKDEVKK